jgi:hypothetical protein
VACFQPDGTPVDAPFLLRFIAGSASTTRGFVLADRPGSGTFIPDWSHGVHAGAVTRTGEGRYTVDLHGSAGGAVEVVAVGLLPRHCAVVGRRGDLTDVACTTKDGTATDSTFTASFTRGQNILDDLRKPVGDYLIAEDSPTASAPTITTRWASGNTPMTLDRTAQGKYTVHFNNGYIPSTTHVTATGSGNHCGLMQFNDHGTPDSVLVKVSCYDSAGKPINTGFTLVYTSARIH